jgi:TatD DNase family protein
MIIDSHCHLHDEKFKNDLPLVLERAQNCGITQMITIGCDIKTTQEAYLLAKNNPPIYFTAGFHPHDAKHLNDHNLKTLKALAQEQKCVAIGECGLDYYYLHSSIKEQQQAFKWQITLALELDLPLVIHLRDAFTDCLDILQPVNELKNRVVIHCFSGTLKEAKIFGDLGYYISLSGIITFKKPGELIEVAKHIPLELLLVETDAPYLAPHPFRGKRNEPSLIIHTIEVIAQAKNQDISTIKQQLYKNTKNFFGI